MSRLRSLPALTATILLVASIGPLATLAGGSPHRKSSQSSKRHARALAHKHHRAHGRAHARRRTRGYRGVHPAQRFSAPRPSAASTRAFAIAAVLATSCQNTELIPNPANLDVVRAAVLCLINRERALQGEPPLAVNPRLQQAAEGHDHEMISGDYFQHVSPTGVTPVDRIRSTGYMPNANEGYVLGENLAWGTLGLATPQATVEAWIASPGHLANILEAQYTETGIGITPQVPPSLSGGTAGATYTQEFGVIIP